MAVSLSGTLGAFGEIRDLPLQGVPGAGSYFLFIRPDIRLNSAAIGEKITFRQLSALLRIPDKSRVIASGIYLGSPVIDGYSYSDPSLDFLFKLMGFEVEALEQIRNGGDLELTFGLTGECEYGARIGTFSSQGNFTIRQQDWLKALGDMGFQESLLFELNLPTSEQLSERMSLCLGEGRTHLENGQYKNCVGCCRELLEMLETERQDQSQVDRAKNCKTQERDLEQRLLMVREAIREVTHLAHHNSEDSFSRSQAKVILGITVTMLSQFHV